MQHGDSVEQHRPRPACEREQLRSSYYDYLFFLPVGVTMEMELISKDEEALFGGKEADLNFSVKKVGTDEWQGVPNAGGVSSRKLFDFVVERSPGKDGVTVSHGADPRKVIPAHHIRSHHIRFFTIDDTIELNSDDEDEAVELAALGNSSRSIYEKVRCCEIEHTQFVCCLTETVLFAGLALIGSACQLVTRVVACVLASAFSSRVTHGAESSCRSRNTSR